MRTHMIEIEVEDTDDAYKCQDLVQTAMNAAHQVSKVVEHRSLEVTSVRVQTYVAQDTPPPAARLETVDIPYDAPVKRSPHEESQAVLDAEDDPDNPLGYPGHGG